MGDPVIDQVTIHYKEPKYVEAVDQFITSELFTKVGFMNWVGPGFGGTESEESCLILIHHQGKGKEVIPTSSILRMEMR